jgi:hypothetical protein
MKHKRRIFGHTFVRSTASVFRTVFAPSDLVTVGSNPASGMYVSCVRSLCVRVLCVGRVLAMG